VSLTTDGTAGSSHAGEYTAVDWSRALAAVVTGTDQPTLVAQPIVDLATGTIAGYELLSRFTTTPSAPPDVWFAQADRLGYAAELTARVATTALALRHTLPPGHLPHLQRRTAPRDPSGGP
jgi:EAL domain-containing protein (putative c-di-GMP-specific phosphodiesterase class I)